jgi:hypothetical protein
MSEFNIGKATLKHIYICTVCLGYIASGAILDRDPYKNITFSAYPKLRNSPFKGAASRYFSLLGFHQKTPPGPLIHGLKQFRKCLEFDLFKFKAHLPSPPTPGDLVFRIGPSPSESST